MTGRWVSPVGHDRMCPVVIFRFWMLTRNDRKLRSCVRSLRSSASGHNLNVLMTIEIGRSTFEAGGHVACIVRPDATVQCPVDLTNASGRPVF